LAGESASPTLFSSLWPIGEVRESVTRAQDDILPHKTAVQCLPD